MDVDAGMKVRNVYRIECFGPDGKLKWVEEVPNLTVNVGLNDLLSRYFKGSAYTAAWYVGLIGASPTLAAADTMASHSGWTEVTAYSQANRPTLSLGAVSGQSVSNSGSVAVFSMNGTYTVSGAFVVTDNTVGGTAGTLYGEATFTTPRSGASGDTLNVTVTLTAATA